MFSLSRFLLTFSKEFRENRRSIAMQIFLMAGTLCLFTILIVSLNRHEYYDTLYNEYNYISYNEYEDPLWDNMCVMFGISMMIFGTVSASLLMNNMDNRQKRLSTLVYPASQLEKYMVRWFIYVPFFIIVFAISCFVADLLRYVLCISFIHEPIAPIKLFLPTGIFKYLDIYNNFKVFNVYIAVFLIAQSLYALGSCFLQRQAFIKTFISLAVIAMLYYLIGYGTYEIFTSDYSFVNESTSQPSLNLLWIFTIAICVINYSLGYMRFRESELIQRW